jgi:acyl-coenzyme A thioesterase PaaI-like protein
LKHPFRRSFCRVELVAVCTAAALVLTLGTSAAFAHTEVTDPLTLASAGTGTYVCSPSGFGQKSRCYLR